MKRLLILIVGLVFLVSCAKTHRVPKADYKHRSGGEYIVASWYGEPFHGRQTACGERYDMYGISAAHKTMKFGTKLRVTNPDNDKSVVVIVTDRGPFIKGRDLDLSYGAAKKIGHVEKGVGKVYIKHLGRDMRYAKRVSLAGPGLKGDLTDLTVQVGSFSERANAARLKKGLDFKYSNVRVTSTKLKGKKYYRVRVGKFDSRDSAYSIAEKLADEGYPAFITSR